MIKKITLIIIFNLFFCTISFSQNDTIKKDSTTIYHNIHKYSQKGKFSKFVYRLFFRSSKLDENKIKPTIQEEVVSYEKWNGKIIRKIAIKTLDPFGYSIQDSTRIPKKDMERFGNAIHLKTKKITIRNLLLFNKNEPFDNLKSKESERLIRSQRYVRRVSVEPKEIANNQDSVDVVVTVLDSWTLLPNGSFTANQAKATLRERNLYGLGHQINGSYKERFEDKEKAISGNYSINNIKNTYIRFTALYENDFDNNSYRAVSLNRGFFSALTNWAGGIYFENRLQNEGFTIATDSIAINPLKSEFQEYWVGRSFKLFNKNDYDSRTTRLITSLTYNFKNYLLKPTIEADPTSYFSNQKNIISQIGITSQKFYKDSYIFNYDIVEDIPYGETATIIIGYQHKNNIDRLYLGSKLSYGRKYIFGYLSNSLEYGSFFHQGDPYQSTLKFEMYYFSPLFLVGKWKARQFLKPYIILGNNRDASEKDIVTLENTNGIQGFNSLINGTKKWVVSLQTQIYSPGNWKGFRFGPYLNVAFGSLSSSSQSIFNSKVYSKIGIGILINNDYLVFNNFQISFSYYPSIPFEGNNIIKTNSFENDDFTLPEYQLSKPYYIRYQ